MVKPLQKIGNSRGIVIDKAILSLLNVEEGGAFELVPMNGGLFLKPVSAKSAYEIISKRHRKSLDKLGK